MHFRFGKWVLEVKTSDRDFILEDLQRRFVIPELKDMYSLNKEFAIAFKNQVMSLFDGENTERQVETYTRYESRKWERLERNLIFDRLDIGEDFSSIHFYNAEGKKTDLVFRADCLPLWKPLIDRNSIPQGVIVSTAFDWRYPLSGRINRIYLLQEPSN